MKVSCQIIISNKNVMSYQVAAQTGKALSRLIIYYLYGAAQASMYASTALRVCRSGALSDFGHEAGSGADISLIDAYLQQLLPALAKSKAAAASKGVEVQRKCGSTERSVQTHK
jgi:hypothetical protein